MSLISTSIPNLVNGVSQQPFMQRLVSQGEIQDNGYSSLVEGLRKRPPTTHVAKLQSTPLSNAYLHTINRSATEQYTVLFNGTSLSVFDMVGHAKTVTFPNGTGYLTDASPSSAFTATTVADYTFIVNKNTTVIPDPAQVAATRPFEALVWIKEANYACKYAVQVGGRLATKNTLTSSNAANGVDIQTSNICNDLFIMLTTGAYVGTSQPPPNTTNGTLICENVTGSLAAGITITNLGSSLYISSATDFSLTASDGLADTAIVVCKNSVKSFSDLPARAQAGMVMQISSTANDAQNDAYWVVYTADANNPYGGVWVECPKPGEGVGVLASTMPHVLIRNADGTFTFKEATWLPRKVGSLAMMPWPTFINRTINDIFFYQGRLGVLSGENIVMGVTSDTFNFFRATALQVLDTDPIDLASTSTKVATLRSAVPFQGTLLLFADQTQFQVNYTNLLSPKTVEIVQATNFESSLQAKPVGAGPNVYFAVPKGTYTGIREFYLDGVARVNDANDTTAHVPSYIKGNPVKMAVASNESCLVVLGDAFVNELFVYRYYWQQGQKMQSSWSRWLFPTTDTILNVDFITNTLYLVVSRSDGVYLESVNILPGVAEPNSTFTCHLDRKTPFWLTTISYDAGANVTTVTLPYTPADWTQFQCIAWAGDATYDFGALVTMTPGAGGVFTVQGNLTSFYVGRIYTFHYKFTTFTTREPVPMTYTQQAVTEGRLQIRNVLLNYATTGYFRAVVTPFARDASTYIFSGRSLGVQTSLTGAPSLQTGVFKFPVQCQNLYASIELFNDSYLPSAFESAGWEGFFVLRSRRM